LRDYMRKNRPERVPFRVMTNYLSFRNSIPGKPKEWMPYI